MKKLTPGKKWMLFTALFALLAMTSFFQINSYWADKHNFNGLFGWLGVGIVLGLVAVYGLVKVVNNSNTGRPDA